ncbi:hypothetical protein BDV26DRAFT_251325 [Aspergillus bertholletiae]|uniref:Uncharacterized protein n=1 Tax=Aspergillus bertholletiae TaxID=1226010 RepID=A0A5N7BP61_9EURO|nr:hypothetical protein BDV26DRAFT_251325 [Aspergillus bertholletiae]
MATVGCGMIWEVERSKLLYGRTRNREEKMTKVKNVNERKFFFSRAAMRTEGKKRRDTGREKRGSKREDGAKREESRRGGRGLTRKGKRRVSDSEYKRDQKKTKL